MKRRSFLKLLGAPLLAPLAPSAKSVLSAPAARVTASEEGAHLFVENTAYFGAGDIINVARTAEKIRVTAVSPTHLTVVRGVGSRPAEPVRRGDDLLIMGNAYADGHEPAAPRDWMEPLPPRWDVIAQDG